jgi:phage FluMu protein Com
MEKTVLKCNFCGKTFTRHIGKNTTEIQCPKCHEIDVEVIGFKYDRFNMSNDSIINNGRY